MSKQLAFPPHEGLPFQDGPPTVDGYVEPDPGIPITELEAGYTRGSRYTYDDTSGASSTGAATTVFQGIKHNNADLIYLAWVIRFDIAFEESDRIICCVRPSAAAAGDERLINIQPLFTGGGAGGGPGTTPAPGVEVKTNRDPRFNPTFYRPAAAPHKWQQIPAPGIANVAVKVRSSVITGASAARYWSVEMQLPTKKAGAQGGGADWIDLQQSFGLYFNAVRVGPGADVLADEFCVEFAWPDPTFLITDPMTGSVPIEDWDIPNSYYGEGLLVPPGGPNPMKGVRFVQGSSGIGVLNGGVIGGQLDMTLNHVNPIVARVFNDDTTAAQQVSAEFRIADFGIGPYGNAALWDKIDIHGPGNPTPPTDIPANGPAANSATWKDLIANWPINAADRTKYQPLWRDQCLWALLDSAAGAQFAESSVRRNLYLVNLSEDDGPVTVSGQGHGEPADGKADHDFFLHVVDVKYQSPYRDDDGGHDSLAVSHRGQGGKYPPELNLPDTITGEVAASNGEKETVTWLHVTNGYRRTGEHLTLDGRKLAIWTHAGGFASIARHELEEGETRESAALGWEFSGGGIAKRAEGLYYLPVPKDGNVRLRRKLRAGNGVEGGDPKTPVQTGPLRPAGTGGGPDDTKGCLPAVLAVLAAIVAAIRKLFKK